MKSYFKLLIIVFTIFSCENTKKNNSEEKEILKKRTLDSISNIVKKQTIDSLEKDSLAFFFKVAQFNFENWMADTLSVMPKDTQKEGFNRKIEQGYNSLDIIYTRKISLKGKYKGNDKIIEYFFFTIFSYCPEMKYLFKGNYELDLKKTHTYFPIRSLHRDLLNRIKYESWQSSFNKANVITNDTIYSFEITKGDCRGVESKKPVKK